MEPTKTTPSPELTKLSIENTPRTTLPSGVSETPTETYSRIKAVADTFGTTPRNDNGGIDKNGIKAPRTVTTPSGGDTDTGTDFYQQAVDDETKRAQREINSINKYAAEQIASMKPRQEERIAENAAVNTLTGLAGSTEANITTGRVKAINEQENKLIRAEAAAKVQNILGKISEKALQRAQFERESFTLNAEQKEKQRVANLTEAANNVATLAQSGVSWEKYKEQDPESFSYLAETMGGEELLKASFTLNRPVDSILDKRVEGGKYVIAYQNPIDGSVRVESVDLGLPPQYTKTVDAGNRIVAIPDNWSGDPSELITINKGLTPSQAAGGGGSAGLGGGGTYESDLDAVVGNVLNLIPSENGKEAFLNSINRARNDKDKIDAIASTALRNSPAEIRNDFFQQGVGINSIDKAIAQIDKGLESGFLQEKAQYVFNVFGKDFDPNLAAVNAYITSAIQPYRNSVTGAAWGTQEDGEYQQLFGSTKYSPIELRSRLVRVKEILRDKSAAALITQISPISGFDVYNYGQSNANDPVKQQVDAAGYDYDAMIQAGYTPDQILSAIQQ